jgi:tetraacyldisaccharide 4'-kinase
MMSRPAPPRPTLGAIVERWLVRVWYGGSSPGDRALSLLLAPLGLPLSWLVAATARRRLLRIRRQRREARPRVVVVGNLVAGGAGKTPTVIALARGLSARGHRVGLLARGYRRTATGAPLLIDAAGTQPRADVSATGDEPLLLARATGLPVAVGVDRGAALDLLARRHPDCTVVLSDDGLQHTGLERAIELVVIDERGFGNGRCLPAGPLREPTTRLASVDAVVLHRCDRLPPGTDAPPFQFRLDTAIERFRAVDGSADWSAASFVATVRSAGDSVAAVAAIARPERFFDDLARLGLEVSRHPLADHATIDPHWLAVLDADRIVITAKDAVKISAAQATGRLVVAEQTAAVDEALLNWLSGRLPAPDSGYAMDARLLDVLVCPICKGPLKYDRNAATLTCVADRLVFPVRDGIPVMIESEASPLADDAPR